jgi:hypothetical protein
MKRRGSEEITLREMLVRIPLTNLTNLGDFDMDLNLGRERSHRIGVEEGQRATSSNLGQARPGSRGLHVT